jgi:hypothetical protein
MDRKTMTPLTFKNWGLNTDEEMKGHKNSAAKIRCCINSPTGKQNIPYSSVNKKLM